MISLIKKAYVCNACSDEGKILLAIKKNHEIVSELPSERIEDFENLSEKTLYTYEVVRDENDFPLYKEARKACCNKCQSKDIVWKPGDNEDNVLNFFGQSESGKWFRGFQDLSH